MFSVGLLFSFFKIGKKTPKLSIELVPYKMHGYNVRSRLTDHEWERVCKQVRSHIPANKRFKCQICGSHGNLQGFNHPVECHEIWEFDYATKTQKLTGIVSLCPLCHKVKHIGLATKMGFRDKVIAHMKKVNNMTEAQVLQAISDAEAICKTRQTVDWKLDLTYLNKKEFYFLATHFTDNEAAFC